MSEEIIQDGLWYLLARFYGFEDTVLNQGSHLQDPQGRRHQRHRQRRPHSDGGRLRIPAHHQADRQIRPAYYERPDTPIH